MKKILKPLSVFILIAVLFYARKALAEDTYLFEDYDCSALSDPQSILECYLTGRVMTLVLTIGSLLSIIFIIYGGFQYITSTGDPGKLKTAKNIIIGACVGLAIIIMSYNIRDFAIERVINKKASEVVPTGSSSSANINEGSSGGNSSSGTSSDNGTLPAPSGSPGGTTALSDQSPAQVSPFTVERGLTPREFCERIQSNAEEQYDEASLKAVVVWGSYFEVFYKAKSGGNLFYDIWQDTPNPTKHNFLREAPKSFEENTIYPPSTTCETFTPPSSNTTGDLPSPSGLPAV